jgi:predicted amidohydrolase YtcJ
MAADLMLRNMAGQRLDGHAKAIELIAIQGNRITYAGTIDALDELSGPNTRVIDCQGGMVLPGFNDAHCHPVAFAMTQRYLDCSARQVGCISDIQALLRKQAGKTGKERWLRGAQLDATAIVEQRLPNRWELDQAVSHLPVILVERSGQHCVLNSRALARCGIDDSTPDSDAEILERDPASGKPNGVVSGNSERIARTIPPLADDEIEAGMRYANNEYLSHGITSLQDTTWSNSPAHWQTLQAFKQRDLLAPRLTLLAGYDFLAQFVEEGLTTGSGDADLKLGGMKIALDESSGLIHPPQDDLDHAALQAHLAGFQLAFHVPDITLLQSSLRALAYVRALALKACRRPRFEHCPVCPTGLLPDLAQSGAIVVSQPNLLFQTGPEYLEQVSTEQMQWVFPYRSFLNHGIRLAFSSDSPLTPCDPLQAIQTAITRKVAGGKTLAAEEWLTLAEALEMYSAAGAYASGDEQEKGRLSVGQLADLIVLKTRGTTLPEELAEAEVIMTLINGKVHWTK